MSTDTITTPSEIPSYLDQFEEYDGPPVTKWSKRRRRAIVPISLTAVILVGVSLIINGLGDTFERHYGAAVAGAIFWTNFGLMLVVLVGFFVYNHIDEKYRQTVRLSITQGEVLRLYTKGGGIFPIRWMVEIKGYNCFNELDYRTFSVDAGRWHKEYERYMFIHVPPLTP